jgi:hypothetical protein
VTGHAYGSPIVGYIRSPRLSDPELDVLEAQIREYAREHGYNLVKVFREEGISSVAAWRPELEKLIRGLERREWVGVIVPDEGHWSARLATVDRILKRIEASRGWTIAIGLGVHHPILQSSVGGTGFAGGTAFNLSAQNPRWRQCPIYRGLTMLHGIKNCAIKFRHCSSLRSFFP